MFDPGNYYELNEESSQLAAMSSVASNVAVIGSGISGTVCASILAKNGISVTIFESARGPGGRMSQRREIAEDGRELLFDHGAPCFSLNASNSEHEIKCIDYRDEMINAKELKSIIAVSPAKDFPQIILRAFEAVLVLFH
ncbi:unnamed protein product [Fraxinus pennsylvanica]|uniref:Uncharacterized protein n=1 Tax=Fraxinus pennsylvanica TaxID=56036 RepID=A0AAD1YQ62_9LAMI|nr:unnamed protein product [Fraxinus pennsylvanica]